MYKKKEQGIFEEVELSHSRVSSHTMLFGIWKGCKGSDRRSVPMFLLLLFFYNNQHFCFTFEYHIMEHNQFQMRNTKDGWFFIIFRLKEICP